MIMAMVIILYYLAKIINFQLLIKRFKEQFQQFHQQDRVSNIKHI